ncbi:hypothetical protein [Longirhabdus pacifica]|uniref:hypothetical protein n=1 Tax=Longirhabdus pacifica TaxID=2305227 RepID=UPI001008E00B|nr:hypothetical protein [Longirhabdus pacifica]
MALHKPVSDEVLDQYRLNNTKIRVVRDADPANDVVGRVVAWDEQHVLIRKQNRNVRKLLRTYHFEPASEERTSPFTNA